MALTMQDMVAEGGWGMHPVMLLGSFGIVTALRHALAPSARIGVISAVLLGSALASGIAVKWYGLQQMEAAIANIPPEMAAAVRAQGSMEANRTVELGIGVLGLGAVPLLIGFLRRPKAAAPAEPVADIAAPQGPPSGNPYAPPRTGGNDSAGKQRPAYYRPLGFLCYCLSVWIHFSSALMSGLIVATRDPAMIGGLLLTFGIGALFVYGGVRLRVA